jgi:phage terminase large subunit-like protein
MSSSVDSLQYYAKAIAALNKLWTPHANQIAVGRAIFLEGIKRINLVMGRRFGKSSLIANIVIRVALSKPYSACVILCPTIKASRKIYWHSGLLKRMLPMEFVEGINNTEGRITFTNGSYIEVTGADDPDSLRGTGIAIYAVDEYKDHKPNVLNVISPALIDGNGILAARRPIPSRPQVALFSGVLLRQPPPRQNTHRRREACS